jgi:hypothetical protein
MKMIVTFLAALSFVAVAFAAERDRPVTAVYGQGWILGIRVPDGWQTSCCEKADKFGANLILWRGSLPVDNGFGVMRITVWPKDGSTIEEEWTNNQTQFKGAFPSAEFKPLKAPNDNYKTISAIFNIPGQYSDYVTFIEPGGNSKHRVSVALSSKTPLTETELSAYLSVVKLAEGKL